MLDRPRAAIVSGGAGFIGRWVVKRLLGAGLSVHVIDDLSSGSLDNLNEFGNHPALVGVEAARVQDIDSRPGALPNNADIVFHLAARINVQDSIDRPRRTFDSDVLGTFRMLEWARQHRAGFVFVSSCMVYAPADGRPINEQHPVLPASPYAAAKLAGENLVLSYGRAYDLPVCVLRPFNTYGPCQRSDGEGGVVAVFLRRTIEGRPLTVFGDGSQTRDLLYVEDCAEFIVSAGLCANANGRVLNAGTGTDIPIVELANRIARGQLPVVHARHPHPQAEISRLVCDARLAREITGFAPRVELGEGIRRTREWLNVKIRSAESRRADASYAG